MKLYGHLPWDVDSSRINDAIALLHLLRAGGVLIASHTPLAVCERLLSEFPHLEWIIRAKGNRKWWPDDLNSQEWPGERTPLDACRWVQDRTGKKPILILQNEVDVELPPDWQADDPATRRFWIHFYRDRAAKFIAQLRFTFGDTVSIALSPLSQGGPPDRFTDWVTGLTDLYGLTDAIVEHCYFSDRPFDDPEWGGRYLRWAEWAPTMPLVLGESNDDGKFYAQDPEERASAYADYATSVALSGKVQALTEFILPGDQNDHKQPAWWFLTPEICRAVRRAVDAAQTPVEQPETPPQVILDPPITFIPVEGASMPEFQLGFKAKADELGPAVVGEPLEDQDYLPLSQGGEIAFQTTTTGMMVYSKAANKVHFLSGE